MGGGSLPALRSGTKPGAETERQGRAQQEAARLHTHDEVDLTTTRRSEGERLDDVVQALPVSEQRG